MKLFKKLVALILVAVLLATPVFAEYGSGSSGLNPYGSGSSGLNPYGIGTGGLNPYGSGSSGLNPYGSGSSGLNPYGTSTSDTSGTTSPVPNPTPSPNPNPSPGPTGGTTWATLNDQTIPEDSPTGTVVYPGLRKLCFDSNGVNMRVTTTSSNFDLAFSGDNLVLNRLTTNFNGQELVGLDCNGRANSFVLTVSAINDAPTFTSTPLTSATVNRLYSYDADAVDVEGNAITFALITSPSGMTIDSNSGLVSWRPSSSQTGSHTVQIRVTDSNGAANNQAYSVSVSKSGSNGGSSSDSDDKENHNVEIASVKLDKNLFVCGENFKATVSLINLGDFSEAVNVRIENKDLGISQSANTQVAKGATEDIEFSLNIPEDEDKSGLFSLVTKLSYSGNEDYEYKQINVNCEKEKEIKPVITTSEDEKGRNWGVIITLILAILAGSALLVWFVLLLKDEFMTTEKFI